MPRTNKPSLINISTAKSYRKKNLIEYRFLPVLVLAVILWGCSGSEISLASMIAGIPLALDFLQRSLPPDLSVAPQAIKAVIETVQISLASTCIGASGAFGLAFLAARNTTPAKPIYLITRGFLNAGRSIPALLYALVFVSMVGLGPFPGTLALAITSLMMLGKLFSEVVESIDPGVVEAVKAVGANRFQVIMFAVLPQIAPQFASYILYAWEINIRSASVLGLVGAGGIGYQIITYMRLFQYRSALTVIIVLLVAVTALDQISSMARRHMI